MTSASFSFRRFLSYELGNSSRFRIVPFCSLFHFLQTEKSFKCQLGAYLDWFSKCLKTSFLTLGLWINQLDLHHPFHEVEDSHFFLFQWSLWDLSMFFQAFERGDNINTLADKTESLRDQVNQPNPAY